MARLFNDAASDVLVNANAVVAAMPLTMACWFYPDDMTISAVLMGIGNGGGADYFELNFGGTVAGDPVRALSRSGGATAIAVATTGATVNTWHHACAVFTSATSRAAFIDGGSKGTNATSNTPSTMTQTVIGKRANADLLAYFSGRIAEAAIWNVALSDMEVAALAKGIAPPYIQPAALVGYWPLWALHSPEIDLTANNRLMTVTGTVAANHAPVQPFSHRLWGSTPVIETAAAGNNLAQKMMYYKRMRAA